jgi:hypothetical protein
MSLFAVCRPGAVAITVSGAAFFENLHLAFIVSLEKNL